MNSHQRRKQRRSVERGFGPRHAFNAQEGDELVPEELPGPPPEDLRIRPNSMTNLRPANLLKALGGELGSLTKEDVAKLGISLLMGGEGPTEPSLPPSGKVPQPGLKFHDPHPRYEGPPEAVKEPFSGFNEQQMQEALKQAGKLGGKEQEAFWSMFWKKHHNPEMSAGDLMKSQPDNTFPSLNKPPYDALKEPPSDSISHLKGQDWLDAYMKKLDEAGLVEPSAQAKQDALDMIKEPPAKGKNSGPSEELPPSPDEQFLNPPVNPENQSLPKTEKEWQAYWDNFHKTGGKQDVSPPDPDWEPPPRFRKGTTGVRHNPKTKTGRPKKIGVDPGFGPRHAANAKEGEDLTQVNTDTVPAMLTPREAVLNRNAAELAGRPNIEALNEQGNELAKQGVDLASGESNVPDPKAGDRRLAGGGAESALLRQLYEKYGNLAPEYLLYPDVLNEIQNQGIGDTQMAQRGTANMKPKPKSPPSKPKPSGKPTPPQSGSPYVQGFEGLQSGGFAGGQPGSLGEGTRNFPHPMAGKMHPQGLQPLIPPGALTGGPEPWQGSGGPGMLGEGTRNFPHPMAGLMHPGAPGALGSGPGGWNPTGGPGAMTPYGGGGEPPGAYGAQPFQGPQGLKGLGSGSFFPKGGQGYADGTTDVTPPIGAANTSAAYGPPIQLTAPDISKILQLEGQKQGLTSSQVAGLAKAFQGFGQGYNELSGGAGSMADMATAASGAYQGGISDIGYPPGIAPNADFSYTEGGWTGPLDPRWSSPGYARGSDDIEPGILGGNRNADSWLADLPPGVTVFGGRHPGSGFINRSNYNPGAWSGGAPGMPWSPTKIPTTYDPQGYPYGVPVQGPDQNVQGVGRTHNLRQNQ